MPDPYTILHAGEVPVAGIMELPASVAAGARPSWVGYIGVDDVDTFSERVVAAGGKIHRPPDDIPGRRPFRRRGRPARCDVLSVQAIWCRNTAGRWRHTGPGRLARVARRATENRPSLSMPICSAGRRLRRSTRVRWAFTRALQPAARAGDTMTGGMMTKTDAIPQPMWLYYFNVDDTGKAASRVRDAGGQVLMGPHQVPGGNWIAQCLDPQGAMFAVRRSGTWAG